MGTWQAMKYCILNLVILAVLSAALAFGFGVLDGKKEVVKTRQEKFRESVYRQNDKWCKNPRHRKYCKTSI